MSYRRPPTCDPRTARAVPPVAAYDDRACRDVDLKIFFPPKSTHADEAREICGRCNCQAECLQWALDTEQAHGIWGGTSPDERFQLLKAREDS